MGLFLMVAYFMYTVLKEQAGKFFFAGNLRYAHRETD